MKFSSGTEMRAAERRCSSGLRRRLLGAFAAVTLLAIPALAANTPISDPIPATIPKGDVTVNLVRVAGGLVAPVTTAVAPGDKHHLYVVDQIGKLWAVPIAGDHHGRSQAAPPAAPTLALDVSARLVALGLFGVNYDERGFLGVAFHPNFRHNGLLYTFTSEPPAMPADFSTQPTGVLANHQTVITEWRAQTTPDDDGDTDDSHPARPVVVDPNSSRVLLRIDKPQFNHEGGTLAFGRDGYLYITLGDGGAANDFGPGHSVGGNGQDLTNVLGKILRIDPRGRNSANGQYGIPRSNPFVGKPGINEIWAYGFRNPYRVSFDRKTGALLIADVGQNDIEEIDVGRAGANYGWPVKEGTFLFDQNAGGRGFVFADSPAVPAGLVDPLAQYDHSDLGVSARIAILGGYIYRGERNRSLRGRYVFGDYNTSFFSPVGGHVYYLDAAQQIKELKFSDRASLGTPVLGLGEDANGEVYVLANSSGVVAGTAGVVYRLEEVPVGRKRD